MYLHNQNLAKAKVKKLSKNLLILPLILLIFPGVAAAQIVPDTSLPINSIVTPDGNTNTITGGTRAGSNLFHSFQQFSIPTNGSAIFNNPLDIQNIITRVTGSSISNIDGLLKTQGTANFFLLNPNGIIFGANARLDIGGSFLASTAHTLKFADGSELGTTATATPPLLTVSVPTGLQFGGNSGSIIVQGQGQDFGESGIETSFDPGLNPLQVNPGNTLTLAGGQIQLDGGILQAPGGRVELAAIASGTIGLNSDLTLNIPNSTTENPIALSDVFLSNRAGINVVADGSGSITINARNIDINQNSLLSAGVASDFDSTDNSINEQIGDITLNATVAIAIDASRIENNINAASTATSGNISITSGSLTIKNGAGLDTGTDGNGYAGDIVVIANDFISLSNDSYIYSDAYNDTDNIKGVAGYISLEANNSISIANSEITSENYGKGTTAGSEEIGAIYLKSNGAISLSDQAIVTTSTFGTGNGGDISINSQSFSVLGGSQVLAKTEGSGDAGKIMINTDDHVTIAGSDLTNKTYINTSTYGKGNAGYIEINTDEVLLDNGYIFNNVESGGKGNAGNMNIYASNLYLQNGSQIQTIVRGTKNNNPAGNGNAGTININARNQIIMSGISNSFSSAIFSSVGQDAQGDAGSITIKAGSLSLTDRANLTVTNNGIGKAGDLIIATDFLNLDGRASLRAESVSGNGGNITLATRAIQLRDNSNITTSATGTATPDVSVNGGNIIINTNTLVALEDSDISANSFDGNGGRVSLVSKGIYGTQFRDKATPQSDITASSDLGPDFSGVVEISTPNLDPSQGLVQLQVQVLDTESQIVQACAVAKNNRFIVTGRGGLPPSPNDALSNDNVWIDLRDVAVGGESNLSATSHNRAKIPVQIVEAQGWTVTSDGKIVLTAQSPNVTPRNSGLISPSCN